MRHFNRQMLARDDREGWRLRIYHRKATRKKSARLLIKCGDCDESVEIYYGKHELEINGVLGSLSEWRALLEPLLKGRSPRKPSK